MTKSEMRTFIEEMEEIGDIWTIDEVARCYANTSLREALETRKAEVGLFLTGLGRAASCLNSGE